MKTLIFLSLVLSLNSFAQNNEFEKHSNGLIYSPQTMNKLSIIVDSLNKQFLSCDINKQYYSIRQSKGFTVKVEKNQASKALKDIENNIGIEEFKMKYPKATISKEMLIVRFEGENYKNEKYAKFAAYDSETNYPTTVVLKKNLNQWMKNELESNWICASLPAKLFSNTSIQAIFLVDKNLSSTKIPEKYNSMIAYSNCMIDTTTSKMKNNLKNGYPTLPSNWKTMSDKKKAKLLDEMRSTRVVGRCSMDNSPRTHAVNIALLSAETANWNIFLKAHLDIMNDRFERVSDGSYAWANRKTYIKELEVLNINVLDLIFGTIFRVNNTSNHHYYGSIGRIGRALSETENRDIVEQTMIEIIKNEKVDDFNRLLTFYLFQNYMHYLPEKQKTKVQIKLEEVHTSLPEHLK